jgi:hypothetical protein
VTELRPYWQAIREQICVRCLDGDRQGNCRLTTERDCTLETHLPRIIQVIKNSSSDAMKDYIRELRLITCAQCTYQSVDGTCLSREDVECQLDRYFPLVVAAIESVDQSPGRHRSSRRKEG